MPTATWRQRGEVHASQTGPELPSLHALPQHVPCHGSMQLPTVPSLVTAPTALNVQPSTDKRHSFPDLNGPVSTLGEIR
jgi:hypothetical protein